jgi:hypothetical protein
VVGGVLSAEMLALSKLEMGTGIRASRPAMLLADLARLEAGRGRQAVHAHQEQGRLVAEALATADELLAALGQGPDRGGDVIDLDRRPPAA